MVYGPSLLNLLRQAGFSVKVAATASAMAFQTKLAWSALSGHPCLDFDSLDDQALREAEVMVAAPVSAAIFTLLCQQNWRQRLTAGRAALLLLPALLPAENTPAAVAELQALLPPGAALLEPGADRCPLGCLGEIAVASPERCCEAVRRALVKQDLAGVRVLITAGPTIEDIDPVRYLSNRSTGKMGLALTQSALRRGATVTLVCGPIALPVPPDPRLEHLPVRSAAQMYEATLDRVAACDIAVLCAAVADFTPNQYVPEKIKKGGADGMSLLLRRTPDILAALGQLPNPPFLVGFAAESTDVELNARHKLQGKCCDIICANDVMAPGCGFAVPTNQVTLYLRSGAAEALPLLSKEETADRIFDRVLAEYVARQAGPTP